MDGVTILQTIEVAQYGWGWNWWAILPIIGAIAFLIMAFILLDEGGLPALCGLCTGLLIVIAIILCMEAKELPPTYQYQVLVENNVNMNDFLEKYTVVEQQGITYIVEAKDE